MTAIVGLALLTLRAPRQVVERVRTALLDDYERTGAWQAFWWASDAYTAAWALRFLATSGGVPERIAASLPAQLEEADARSALESALLLQAALKLGRAGQPLVERSVDSLLERVQCDGGWPPSRMLLVPNRSTTDQPTPIQEPDPQRLMTTSLACRSLGDWLCSGNA
ncbi:hypothetical protein AB0H77_22135 [Streptomyces sp. NPDC050844]|uniref:hypothetical protein n=1 Tax=Streptomyces sp. NPDC050844 TaxID=3155790 RepID=UPI0033FE6165